MASVSRVARRCAALTAHAPAPMGPTILRGTAHRTGALASSQTAFCGRYGIANALGSVRFRSTESDNERDTSRNPTMLGPMNDDIRARYVNIVDSDGVMRRGVPTALALQEARNAALDLVQVGKADDGNVVCRLFNAQKRLFELKKSLKQSKPKQDKEVTLGVKTEAHDIQTKASQVRKFLSRGHKVKVTVKFGREFHLADRATEQLKAVEEAIGAEIGRADHNPLTQYGGVYVHFVPIGSK